MLRIELYHSRKLELVLLPLNLQEVMTKIPSTVPISERILTLPMHTNITHEDVCRICKNGNLNEDYKR